MHQPRKYFLDFSAQLVMLLLVSACSNPKYQTRSDSVLSDSRLTDSSVVLSDGYVLPIKTWPAKEKSAAVVLGVHGFNDYSNAFDSAAHIFADNLITTYAIDQRGFGATEQHGIWAGSVTLQSDLVETVTLLCEKHPGLPLFLLGESMGGAVIISAAQQIEQTCVQGVILSAPAVWGWQTMPWWQTVPLRLFAHTIPAVTVSGEGLDIHPSDNDEMLRALGRDPLIIKQTRIDAIYGLTDLMEAAMVNSWALKLPALILYGEHDEIIPPAAICQMVNILPDRAVSNWRMILYPDGYHMLTRDLQATVVLRDMMTWMRNQKDRLPSGHEITRHDSRLLALSECD
jgi:alpha-beta hydrolase superfamily lysophospholipase